MYKEHKYTNKDLLTWCKQGMWLHLAIHSYKWLNYKWQTNPFFTQMIPYSLNSWWWKQLCPLRFFCLPCCSTNIWNHDCNIDLPIPEFVHQCFYIVVLSDVYAMMCMCIKLRGSSIRKTLGIHSFTNRSHSCTLSVALHQTMGVHSKINQPDFATIFWANHIFAVKL